ncbi:hypothetical protein VTK26DRAFT_1732 [Humicola hyalothermophila]
MQTFFWQSQFSNPGFSQSTTDAPRPSICEQEISAARRTVQIICTDSLGSVSARKFSVRRSSFYMTSQAAYKCCGSTNATLHTAALDAHAGAMLNRSTQVSDRSAVISVLITIPLAARGVCVRCPTTRVEARSSICGFEHRYLGDCLGGTNEIGTII